MSKSISLKSPQEIAILAEANAIVAQTLEMLRNRIKAGISTLQLDRWAEDACRKKGAKPAFKGYRGFPGTLCVSLNEQVVHGIPSKKTILKDGDIVSIDFGVKYKGYYGDSAISVGVGELSPEKYRLLEVTETSLAKGIEQMVAGNRVSDISQAIQSYVEENGFSVVRQFVGHGIGSNLHEAPEVPNYKRKGRSPRLQEGMVLAIEPMVNCGSHEVVVLKDGWTVITTDKRPSAHFEHSVAVTANGPQILSNSLSG